MKPQVDEGGSGVIEFQEFLVLMQRFMEKEADEMERVWEAASLCPSLQYSQ
jgi:Ca2+-binding EF-hand superfamily protein